MNMVFIVIPFLQSNIVIRCNILKNLFGTSRSTIIKDGGNRTRRDLKGSALLCASIMDKNILYVPYVLILILCRDKIKCKFIALL